MQEVQNITFALLRYALCGTEIPDKVSDALTEERLKGVYQLLKMHDLAHLAFDGLQSAAQKIGQTERGAELVNTEVYGMFRRQQQLAVYRYEQKIYEFEQICNVLEEACIPYVPLKGAVLKDLYPQPWMRTSCDIDILVHEQDVSKAVEKIVNRLHYEKQKRVYHEVSLLAENGVHLELHFSLRENNKKLDPVLDRAWEYAARVEDKQEYLLTNEYFMYHHLAHATHHVLNGGCGIRPVADIWLLKQKMQYDDAAVEILCEEAGILTLKRTIMELAEVWFSDKQPTGTVKSLAEYIIGGGVYGTTQNRLIMQQVRTKRSFRYVLSRMFLSYDQLKMHYAVLEKHKWLYPFCQVGRWIKTVFKRKTKQEQNALKNNNTKTKKKEYLELLQDLGL